MLTADARQSDTATNILVGLKEGFKNNISDPLFLTHKDDSTAGATAEQC